MSPGQEGALFLFSVRFLPDGTKLVLDEAGATVRTLARGERLQVSKRDRCRLALSAPERVEVIRRIFAMSAEDCMGLRAIANALNVEGVSSPRGPEWARIYSGSWTASTIRSILTNPLYVGDLVWNRRTDARFFKIVDGRATERREAYGPRLVPNPEKDWIQVPGAHPGIVSHRLFEAAQSARSTRGGSETQRQGGLHKPSAWNGRRSRFLLSGLLECARIPTSNARRPPLGLSSFESSACAFWSARGIPGHRPSTQRWASSPLRRDASIVGERAPL